MTNAEKREFLINELLKVKKSGLRVFVNIPGIFDDSIYGIISDGTNIVTVCFCEYGSTLFRTSFEYVPSRKNGSGCAIFEDGCGYKELTKDVFFEAVNYGKNFAIQNGAKLYQNFDQFLSDRRLTERCTEL